MLVSVIGVEMPLEVAVECGGSEEDSSGNLEDCVAMPWVGVVSESGMPLLATNSSTGLRSPSGGSVGPSACCTLSSCEQPDSELTVLAACVL